MAAIVGSGIKTDETHTSAKFNLGELRFDSEGRGWVYLEADEAIEQYDAVIIHSDYGANELTITTAASGTGVGKRVAVTQVAVASGSFFWGCVYANSDASVNVAGATAVYTRLRPTATGGVLDDTTTAASPYVAGLVTTVLAGTATQAELAVINFPFIDADLII